MNDVVRQPLMLLDDAQCAALVGLRGSMRPGGAGGAGPLRSRGPGWMQAISSLFMDVSQINFSFNIAINGSSIQTSQSNGLLVDASF